MRTLSPEDLREWADRYKLNPALAQRDYVAVRVAHAIASDPGVASELAMKGGFVLRFGYGSPRTSKDIDGTVGTRHSALDPARLQRIVRSQCTDLDVKMGKPTQGSDTLDFGNVAYVGPLGRGFLTIEMSFREDLLLPARSLTIDAFGVPAFSVRALAVDEMIAEKWRCLVQRSPRKPGDPFDLWYLWTVFRHEKPRSADDIIDPSEVVALVPKKVDYRQGLAGMRQALAQYKAVWPAALGDALPVDAPGFREVEAAVLAAAREWTPWR